MSNLWSGSVVENAIRVSPFAVRARVDTFNAWTGTPAPAPAHAGEAPFEAPEAIDIEAIQAAAYAEGVEAGRRAADAQLAAEHRKLATLAASLEMLQPEPPAALGALLAETVGRLVRQVVGEVEIDETRLLDRATAAAQLIGDHHGTPRMRLHPSDLDRVATLGLSVALVADETLPQGALRLDCAGGSIEDGPDVALDGLRAALDKLGIGR